MAPPPGTSLDRTPAGTSLDGITVESEIPLDPEEKKPWKKPFFGLRLNEKLAEAPSDKAGNFGFVLSPNEELTFGLNEAVQR